MSKYYPMKNGLERSSSGNIGYSAGGWRNYMIKQPDYREKQIRVSRLSQRAWSPQSSLSYMVAQEPLRQSQSEKQQKREEMMKRVKQIQQKVRPLLQNDSKKIFLEEVGNNAKLEQKIARMQTLLDQIKKQMDIKIQKKVLSLEKRFNQKMQYCEKQFKK